MKQAPIHLKAVCPPIRIVIADDHPIFIDGFKTLLKKMHAHCIECCGEASNGKELIEQVEIEKPDIVFTDIQMPQMDGIAATKIIKTRIPDTKVIALSGFNEIGLILDMIEAGASGYLLKNTSKEQVFESIQAVSQGKTYYCAESAEKLSEYVKQNKQLKKKEQLTASEKHIVQLICKGFINKEIASTLKLSKRTVENYREKIMEKVDVLNTMELAMYAVKNNIYTP